MRGLSVSNEVQCRAFSSASTWSGNLGVAVTNEPARESFLKVLESSLDDAWRRKESFETRAFALATANLAIATLYFAMLDQLGSTKDLSHSLPEVLIIVALAAGAGSVISAIVSTIPVNYPSISAATLREDSALVKGDEVSEGDVLDAQIDARLAQYARAQEASALRGWLALAAFVLFGIAVAFFIATAVAISLHR